MARIYDFVALRVILQTIPECYAALGIIHETWPPVPRRIKDYVAMPKPNGYRSLHTTVIGPDEKTIEFQIRTKEMHDEDEYGVAAHWLYKEEKGDPAIRQKTRRRTDVGPATQDLARAFFGKHDRRRRDAPGNESGFLPAPDLRRDAAGRRR